jgi:hypothetical protein
LKEKIEYGGFLGQRHNFIMSYEFRWREACSVSFEVLAVNREEDAIAGTKGNIGVWKTN